MEKTFKTKTGFCHITPHQIILTRDGIIGNVARVTAGNNISRPLIIYGLISLGLFYVAYDSYVKGQISPAILYVLAAFFLIRGVISSLNHSASPIIDRKAIKSVKFIKGISGLTRPRFEIEFTEEGKVKKRLIMLRGSMMGSAEEINDAVQIMKEEGLLVTPTL